MKHFKDMFKHILEKGEVRTDRTKTGTIGVFGYQCRFDLTGWKLPMGTAKYVNFDNILAELLWYIEGSTDNEMLKARGCNVWNPWAYSLKISDRPIITQLVLNCFDSSTAKEAVDDLKSIDSADEKAVVAKLNELARKYLSEETLKEHGLAVPGELGPVYGKMWREWPTTTGGVVDQLAAVINTLKTDPTSRRIVISGWNPEFLPVEGASHSSNIENGLQVLPPCHTLFQFHTSYLPLRTVAEQLYNDSKEIDDFVVRGVWAKQAGELVEFMDAAAKRGAVIRKLSCQLYMRSNDAWLGMFYNVTCYSLLTMLLAKEVGMYPGEYIHTVGDLHLYSNHVESARKYLEMPTYQTPTLVIQDNVDFFDHTPESVKLVNYVSGPRMPGIVAV